MLPISTKLAVKWAIRSSASIGSMHSAVQDLPTEIWLSILRHVTPGQLFRTVRLVDQRFKSYAEDVFRNDLLPLLEISIHVSLASEYPLRPGGHAQVLFKFDRISFREGGLETVHLALSGVEPNTRRERALVKLRQPLQADAVTDWQVFEMCLPASCPVSLNGRAWTNFAYEHDSDAVSESHASGVTLRLNWRKLVSAYLSESDDDYVAGI